MGGGIRRCGRMLRPQGREVQGAQDTYHIQEDIDTVRLDDEGYECRGDGHGVNRAALDDDP